jgi:hypothetical protein
MAAMPDQWQLIGNRSAHPAWAASSADLSRRTSDAIFGAKWSRLIELQWSDQKFSKAFAQRHSPLAMTAEMAETEESIDIPIFQIGEGSLWSAGWTGTSTCDLSAK